MGTNHETRRVNSCSRRRINEGKKNQERWLLVGIGAVLWESSKRTAMLWYAASASRIPRRHWGAHHNSSYAAGRSWFELWEKYYKESKERHGSRRSACICSGVKTPLGALTIPALAKPELLDRFTRRTVRTLDWFAQSCRLNPHGNFCE